MNHKLGAVMLPFFISAGWCVLLMAISRLTLSVNKSINDGTVGVYQHFYLDRAQTSGGAKKTKTLRLKVVCAIELPHNSQLYTHNH